jgi:membrane protease YdiL (CAAX protease family)
MSRNKTFFGLFLALAVLLATRIVFAEFFQLSIINALLLFLVPALFIKLTGRNLGEYGLSSGNLKLGLKYAALALLLAFPLMVYASQMPSFREYYPLWKPAYQSLPNLLLYESAIALMMVSTEFFYRGFLLFTLNEKMRYGNLMHAFVYALMHIGKPFLEIPYSFFVGLIFGEADVRCRSILPSFLMHFLGNVAFDLLIIYFSIRPVL